MTRHLLVTNDFPPKLGGIQYYLWELWRRLPPESFVVYTTPYAGTAAFDAEQAYEVRRSSEPVLLPSPIMTRRINKLAAALDIDFVVLDPALPLGAIGPSLDRPYAVVLHGAEVTVPGRLPGSRQLLRRVLDRAQLTIAAGEYPLAEAERAAGRPLRSVVVPPGVDVERFHPVSEVEAADIRRRLDLPDGPLVVSVSRLVPRKGMDTLIRAAALLADRHRDLHVVISGSGRDRRRLQCLIDRTNSPATLLGRIDGDDLPGLYAAADLFAMMCRVRWGGLEQEGFGIVFVEAAAAGTPQIAGFSGGATEAVVDGETGVVVDPGDDQRATAAAIDRLLSDPAARAEMGAAARRRAEREFSYDVLARRLHTALDDTFGS
ncbi:MAG: glycosyltransferase family 4 protein [Acidimicrobiia bacterium]|nr:glycosyltransferase family 4 protein [Acidimicrobiia bacterium]